MTDRDQAARFGIQLALIDQTLDDAFGQRHVTPYFTQLNTYHVILEIRPEMQTDPNTLNKLYIKSPTTGQQVPLSAFVRYDTEHVAYLSINHQAQFLAVTLSFELAPGVALREAVEAIQKEVYDICMPRAIVGTFQGTAQAFQTSLKSQRYLIAAYIILGMLYESDIHPLIILSTVPSAGVGALLMLLVFHFDLRVIALIGIVKKNGIMMVDFAIQAEREQHMSRVDSIRQACLLRFRPIMMTTMAALLAAVPLMLEQGTGSQLRQPLTLLTTPVIYLYLDRVNNGLGRGKEKGAPAETASSAPAHDAV